MLIACEDITEAKRAQARLEFFKHVTDETHDPVFWHSPADEFRFVYVNEAACRHFGRPTKELLGMSVPDVHPNYPLKEMQKCWEELRRRKAITIETCESLGYGREELIGMSLSDINPDVDLDANWKRLDAGEQILTYEGRHSGPWSCGSGPSIRAANRRPSSRCDGRTGSTAGTLFVTGRSVMPTGRSFSGWALPSTFTTGARQRTPCGERVHRGVTRVPQRRPDSEVTPTPPQRGGREPLRTAWR